MPLIQLQSNPLMEMADKSALLNLAEKALGVSCILLMIFLVRADGKWFSLEDRRDKLYFSIAMLALAGYYVGWFFYFNGVQSLPIMLGVLVPLPPIYYAFIGLWRKNYPLAALGGMFLFVHIANVWNNLM